MATFQRNLTMDYGLDAKTNQEKVKNFKEKHSDN